LAGHLLAEGGRETSESKCEQGFTQIRESQNEYTIQDIKTYYKWQAALGRVILSDAYLRVLITVCDSSC
jgi:hypothetical protein